MRPKEQKAALLFGSAIDAALTSMMKEKDKKPEDVFMYFWRFQEVNGEKTYLPSCPDIVYSNRDYDKDLLDDKDISKLKEIYNLEDPIEEVARIYRLKEEIGFKGLPQKDKIVLNHANWLTLVHKGLLMLEGVRKFVLPNIEEVLGVQEYVTLENQDGDSVIGYVDLICKWKGIKDPIIVDFKTSAMEYKENAVLTSPQLTLYVHALSDKYKTRKAGFIVLAKNIIKNKTKICSKCSKNGTGQRHKTCDAEINGERCNAEWIERIDPEAEVQILIDDIPEQTENIVLENFDYINQSIKNGIFHRNLQSCMSTWGPCPYLSKCYENKDEGLVVCEDRRKK